MGNNRSKRGYVSHFKRIKSPYDRPATKASSDARRKCYKRDKSTCQYPYCGSKEKVVPHHIMKYADYPLLRDSINNLILLCQKHHQYVTGREEDFAALFFGIIRNKK